MRRAVTHLKGADGVLRTIIEGVGECRIRYAEPDFETLARSVVFQQLSGASARAIFDRLKRSAASDGRMTAAGILALTEADLRSIGLSRRKANYLTDLAGRVRDGSVDFARLSHLTDAEVIEHLSAVKGIGVWTAQMFLLFALRRPDVLPCSDLGIRSAVRRAYRLRDLPKPARIEAIARDWHPHCSVASWYLWRSLDSALPVETTAPLKTRRPSQV